MTWLPKKPPGQEPALDVVVLAEDTPQNKRTCVACFRNKVITAFSITGRGVDRHGQRHRKTTCDRCLGRRRDQPKRAHAYRPNAEREARRRIEYQRRVVQGLCGKCAAWRGTNGTKSKCRPCADGNCKASKKRRGKGD